MKFHYIIYFIIYSIFNYLILFLPDYFLKVENHNFIEYKLRDLEYRSLFSLIFSLLLIVIILFEFKNTSKSDIKKNIFFSFFSLILITHNFKFIFTGLYVKMNYNELIKLDLLNVTDKIHDFVSIYLYFIFICYFVFIYFLLKNQHKY